MQKNAVNILVKPTHECNLKCDYCYDRAEKKCVNNKIITEDIIKDIITKTARNFKNINWIWHGGEPTIVGIEFYKKYTKIICDIAKKFDSKISFNMQTNGVNFIDNEEYIEELYDLGINISISLDYLNRNKYRTDSKTYYSLLELIKKHKIPIISVIGYEESFNLIENYKKISGLNIDFSFNRMFNGNETQEQIKEIIANWKKYIEHIIWKEENINERTAKSLIKKVINTYENSLCNLNNCLGEFISVNPDGDLFPCDRFGKNNSNYSTINIKDIHFMIDEYFESDIFDKLIEDNEKAIEHKCKKCDVYFFCNGGCKANRLINDKINLSIINEYECIFLREIFSFIFKTLFELTKKDYLKINTYIYENLFENNFITKDIIKKW